MRSRPRRRDASPEPPEEIIVSVKQGGAPLAPDAEPPPYTDDPGAPYRIISLLAPSVAGVGTSCNLWEGGTLLCRYLQDAHAELSLHRSACLELGAGLGACGIKACALGAKSVVLTDLPEAMQLLTYNVRSNLTADELQRVSTVAYTWGGDSSAVRTAHSDGAFDYIFAGDLVYHVDLVRPLLMAIDALATSARTTVLLAVRSRPGKLAQQEAVLTGLQAMGFRLVRVDLPCVQRGTYLVRARRRRDRTGRAAENAGAVVAGGGARGGGAWARRLSTLWRRQRRRPRDDDDGSAAIELDIAALLEEVSCGT